MRVVTLFLVGETRILLGASRCNYCPLVEFSYRLFGALDPAAGGIDAGGYGTALALRWALSVAGVLAGVLCVYDAWRLWAAARDQAAAGGDADAVDVRPLQVLGPNIVIVKAPGAGLVWQTTTSSSSSTAAGVPEGAPASVEMAAAVV